MPKFVQEGEVDNVNMDEVCNAGMQHYAKPNVDQIGAATGTNTSKHETTEGRSTRSKRALKEASN